MQQWAAEHNLDAAQLEAALKQWELEYNADATSKNNALQQWLAEYNLGVDQFNANQEQWEKEFNLSVNDQNNALQQWAAEYALTQQKYADDKAASEQSSLASAGETLLNAGIMPSASQLSAMGITSAQAQEYITLAQAAAALKASSSSGSEGNNKSGGEADVSGLFAEAVNHQNPWSWIKQNYKSYGLTSLPDQSEFKSYADTVGTVTNADIADLDSDDVRNTHSTASVKVNHANGSSAWFSWSGIQQGLASGQLRLVTYSDGTYEVKFVE